MILTDNDIKDINGFDNIRIFAHSIKRLVINRHEQLTFISVKPKEFIPPSIMEVSDRVIVMQSGKNEVVKDRYKTEDL